MAVSFTDEQTQNWDGISMQRLELHTKVIIVLENVINSKNIKTPEK